MIRRFGRISFGTGVTIENVKNSMKCMTNFYMFVDRSVCIHPDVDSYASRRIELS